MTISLRKILELFSTRRFDARYANLQIFALLYKKHFANQKVFKSTHLFTSKLDNCNSVLYGLPKNL